MEKIMKNKTKISQLMNMGKKKKKMMMKVPSVKIKYKISKT